MKYISFTHKGTSSYGALLGDRVVDLGPTLATAPPT